MVHIDKTQAQLIEELEGYREQVARLELLAEVSRAVSSTLDMDTILTEIARMCCEALDVTSVYVSTHDIEAMTTTVIAEYIAPTASPKERISDLGVAYDLETEFPFQAKWSHSPSAYYTLQVDDPDCDPSELTHFVEYGARSTLAVPLMAGEEFAGFIELWESRHKRVFTDDEITLIQSIAKQVSMTIANARLYHDLNESKTQLARQAARYRALYEQSNDAVFILDLEGNILDINPRAAEMLGYSRDEIGSFTFRDTVAPDERPESKHVIQRLLDGQQVPPYERTARRKDGTQFPVRLSAKLVYDEAGNPAYIQTVARDITHRKQTEKQLEKQGELLRQIIDHNPNLVIVKDQQNRFVVVNHATERCYGKSADELLGKTTFDLHSVREEAEAYMRDDREVLETLQTKFIPEEPITYANGELHWHQTTKIPFTTSDGERHVLVVSADITERKRVEQEMIDLATEKERVEVIKNLIANLSHDFKTPLTTINTSLYLLERVDDPARKEDRINTIKQQTQRIERLIHDILDATRLDQLTQLELKAVRCDELIGFSVEQLEPLAQAKHITLKHNINAPPPPIPGNQEELFRAFNNVLENAIYYTPQGGEVSIEVQTDEQAVLITFKDTGIGISEEDLPRIFERFYRADEARSAQQGGTGLGLDIVRKIIDLHGGEIHVESELGVGSTFIIQLPTSLEGQPPIPQVESH